MNVALGLLWVAAGGFSVAGGICDWEWFMNSGKARGVVSLFGRNGARVFYCLLGAAIGVAAVLMAMGVIPMKDA